MLKLLIFWATNTFPVTHMEGVVEVDYVEFDAIYIPPDFSGPIVAIPTDEVYLNQRSE